MAVSVLLLCESSVALNDKAMEGSVDDGPICEDSADVARIGFEVDDDVVGDDTLLEDSEILVGDNVVGLSSVGEDRVVVDDTSRLDSEVERTLDIDSDLEDTGAAVCVDEDVISGSFEVDEDVED